jgi:deubiquitinase DESI2
MAQNMDMKHMISHPVVCLRWKSCPGFIYRRSVWLGTTDMSHEEYCSFVEKLAGKYHANTFYLIIKNCNHFTDDVSKTLTGKPIPA